MMRAAAPVFLSDHARYIQGDPAPALSYVTTLVRRQHVLVRESNLREDVQATERWHSCGRRFLSVDRGES